MDSSSGDDSGKVYDFKDSKTSGVVTVTKLWEDSMSNDERSVPDVSISTAKPGKNPLGYTIIYHENGLTFSDGSAENEILVSSSGKILSGSYKIPNGLFAGWYSDKACTKKVEVDSNGLPVDGLASDMELYAKTMTFVLKKGSDFNKLIPSTATSVVFSDEVMPASATLIDVDADSDKGIVAWMDGTTMVVSSQLPNQKIIAAENCYSMFSSKSNLISIDFGNLDTSNVNIMSYMFNNCSELTTLDLSPLDTQNVINMSNMFHSCSGFTSIGLSSLDTSNVVNMSYMFSDCSNLASLDLTSFNTCNVNDMEDMFSWCAELTSLNLSSFTTNNVNDMNSMFMGCSNLTSLNLSSFNTSFVSYMGGMFSRCSSLTSLDLSNFDTSNVIGMSGLFEGCSKLTELDLSSFNTGKASDMYEMFYSCKNLKTLNLSSFNTEKVTRMNDMFGSCSKLTNLSLGDKFAFVGSNYNLPYGAWYSSDGTAYTSTTIPSNKADTYTRR